MNERNDRWKNSSCWSGVACVGGLLLASCGAQSSPASGGTEGDGAPATCSANVADGGACNAITNVGPLITPTCATGAIPSGTGGIIAEGTYVLTAQTYYAGPDCPQTPLSATIVIAGDCWEEVAMAGTASASASFTAAYTAVVQGNQVTTTPTCRPATFTSGTPTATFTVNGATLSVFTANSAPGSTNPDNVDVFTKQ
jgi:hypothetical protein